MDFNEYQKRASETAEFAKPKQEYQLMYLSMGLAGEVGEIIEKLKHVIRDAGGVVSAEKKEGLTLEIGDALWYLSQVARVLDISFEDVMQANLQKLASRKQRGVLKAEGDMR